MKHSSTCAAPIAPATREICAHARLALDEYAGRAISYVALEEWTELGIGCAILPASQIRKAPSAAIDNNGRPLEQS